MKKLFFILLILAVACQVDAGSYSSGGGSRSFSSGSSSSSRSYSSPSPSRSYSSPSTPSAPSRSYSSAPSTSSSTPKSNYGTAESKASQSISSANAYRAANPIPPTPTQKYTVPPSVSVTRDTRSQTIYRNYYHSSPPTVIYHDSTSFNPFFWMWLADRNSDDQAAWIARHQSEIDQQRLNDMMEKNAELKAKVEELKKQGITEDPTYTPTGVDRDLMYDDKVVQSEEGIPSWFWWFWGSVGVVTFSFIMVGIFYLII